MGTTESPEDSGAVLIFANTLREAKRMFTREWHGSMFDEYTEARVSWLRGKDWLFKEANKSKLSCNIPHIVDSPKVCKACECWGKSELDAEGYCTECAEDRREAV